MTQMAMEDKSFDYPTDTMKLVLTKLLKRTMFFPHREVQSTQLLGSMLLASIQRKSFRLEKNGISNWKCHVRTVSREILLLPLIRLPPIY